MMQHLTRREASLELLESDSTPYDGASVGDLVSRLAHESKELAALEVRRLRVEMRDQGRRAVRAAAAGYVAVDFIALATLALGVGVFFALAEVWGSYAAAAFATSGFLAVIALCAGLVARKLMSRVGEVMASQGADLNKDRRAIRGD